MSKDIFICRTCLIPTPSQFCKIISEYEESRILEMLSYSIPELDMYLVTNPVICNQCFVKLETTFKFKSQCLNNEEKLLNYMQNFGISKVDFSDYQEHMSTNNIDLVLNNNYQKNAIDNDVKFKQESLCEKTPKLRNVPKSKKGLNCKKCQGCILKDSSNAYLHLKVNISPFICAKCDKCFQQIVDLRKHMLGHIKQRKCHICGKSFRDLHVLQKHMWSHTGAKPFACHLCSKQFQQKHCLQQHILQHQGSDSICCKFCMKLFSTKYNAQVHMKTVHKGQRFCDLCRQSFQTRAKLLEHLQNSSQHCMQEANQILQKQIQQEFLKSEPEFASDMTIKNETIDANSYTENTDYEMYPVTKKENESDVAEADIDVVN